MLVLLDKELTKVFKTEANVVKALHSIIQAMPK
jgi:hypothetical protein